MPKAKHRFKEGEKARVLAVDRFDVEIGVSPGMIVTVMGPHPEHPEDQAVCVAKLPDGTTATFYQYDLELVG